MQLVSRVDRSSVLDVRKYLVMPVTKILVYGAAFVCSATGIAGFVGNRNGYQLLIICLLSTLIFGLYSILEYTLVVSKWKRQQVMYGAEVLNTRVYFDDDIRVVGLDNNEKYRLHYAQVNRYGETKTHAVMIAGWQFFIFDKAQADKAGLRQKLVERGVNMKFRPFDGLLGDHQKDGCK